MLFESNQRSGIEAWVCGAGGTAFAIISAASMCAMYLELSCTDGLQPNPLSDQFLDKHARVQDEPQPLDQQDVRADEIRYLKKRLATFTQLIAYDAGIYLGPPNSVLAAQRSLQNGATSLGVDLSLTQDDKLVGAHSSTEWIANSGFPKRAQDLMDVRFEQAELSPTCETFEQFFLSIGVPSSELVGLQACECQRINTVEDFFDAFPGIPIIFDLKASSWELQRRQVTILHELLYRKYPERRADDTLTSLRVFAFPNQTNPADYFEDWFGSSTLPFTFSLGVPAPGGGGKRNNIETLSRILTTSTASQNGKLQIFLTPSELAASSRFFKFVGQVDIICDLAVHELDGEADAIHISRYRDLHSWQSDLQYCVEFGVAAVHTSRIDLVLKTLIKWSVRAKEISPAGPAASLSNPLAEKMMPKAFWPDAHGRCVFAERGSDPGPSLVLLSQSDASHQTQRFSVGPEVANRSMWMRCAGKFATALLVLRLVEIGKLPGLDEPIVEFLQLQKVENHSVLQRLTLRHVMAGVGGLPYWHWTPDWVKTRIMPASRICEEALRKVSPAFVLGSRFQYSNMQWAIVERAVEVATGWGFPDAARRYLFDPLGISNLTYYQSETLPACSQSVSTRVYDINLRAGIGLCSIAADMFLLGEAARTVGFLSIRGVQEVVMDQLRHRFPAAIPSFLNNAPATDFAANGIEWSGRGFAGYYWADEWLVGYGGPEGFWGQKVLLRVKNGLGSGPLLVQWVSTPHSNKSAKDFAKSVFDLFTAAPDRFGSSLPDCQTGAGISDSIAIRNVAAEVSNSSYKTRAEEDALVPECMYARRTLEPLGDHPVCNRQHLRGDSQSSDYQTMAEWAETTIDVIGLRAEPHNVKEFQLSAQMLNEGLSKTCRLEGWLKELVKWPIDKPWIETENQPSSRVRDVYEYARCGNGLGAACDRDVKHVTEACNRLAAASIAWKMRSGLTKEYPDVPSMFDIVRQHHYWMEVYYGKNRLAPRPHLLTQPKRKGQEYCYMFPKPSNTLCRGGLAQYHALASELEDLLPGGRNLWHHEFALSRDFTAYRPLPSLAGFDMNAIANERKILIVAGANGFFRAPKVLMDMYRPYFEFDRVVLFEPDSQGMNVPSHYNASGNVEWVQGFVKVASCDASDLITYLSHNVSPDDFVVVVFDVDDEHAGASHGATMEWGWLATLVNHDLRLIDELYIELHTYKPEVGWHHDRHSAWEQYDVMHQLRYVCGVAVHAWP